MVMETYYRKRRKTSQSTSVSYQNDAEQVGITATDFPALDRRLTHVAPPPWSDHEPEDDDDNDNEDNRSDMQSQIEQGYLYEIDHRHLPPRTPVHLRSIRVVMVSEKTELNVGVRFPSKESLRAFFNYSTRETHPALDEKFVMGIALAEKVLVKLVEAELYSEQKSLVTFWMTDTSADHHHHNNNNITVTHKKGTIITNNGLTEALKRSGMMRWGIRRQVKYLGRHNNSNGKEIITHDGAVNIHRYPSSSSFINGIEGWSNMELEVVRDDDDERGISIEKEKINGDVDEDLEEKDDDDDDDDEAEEGNGDDQENENEEGGGEEEDDDKENLKRKRYSFRNRGVKKPKKENLDDQIKKQKNKKDSKTKKNKGRACRFKEALVLRDPKDRWSAQRYKLAGQNLLSVMKSEGATAEKPILRPQLRAEARKKIGDTGLLDHLLKHMAGKLAPDGKERFRRRHNPDGAMEYWLESADLVNIRRDAGITDPYWVPPPGWKPGDSPTQDPICARELKLLKDGITKMGSDLMATKMKLEDEVGKLRRELEELSASKRKQEEEKQAMIIASNRSDISQKLDQLATSFDSSSKCDVGSSAHVPVEKYKEQLMVISDFVKDIEARIAKSTLNLVEERSIRKESSLMVPTTDTHRKEPKHAAEALIITAAGSSGKKTCKNHNSDQLNAAASEKAAKIQRMKSGFRICKPHGTFLWPNMVKDNSIVNSSGSTQVMVQVEVPTPPSVNSSTALAPPQLLVKPLAEKRAVKLKVSKGPDNYYHEEDGASSYSNYNAALINLNTVPPKPNAMPLVSANASTNPWESGAYYEARNHVMGVAGYHRTENSSSNNNNKKNTSMCCCPCPSDMSNWLALSNLKSVSDDESTHGC
ncbi:hypothetical protein OROHE_014646 [Orobanche hederae]